MKEITLSSGAIVRVAPVPPFATDDLLREHPPPKYPIVKVGGVESRPALKDTPEWAKYQNDRAEHQRVVSNLVMEFVLNYGIVAWKLPGKDKFEQMPPDDWQIPKHIQALYKLKTAEDRAARRAQFIRHVLLQSDKDKDAVESVMHSKKPITKGEIDAAMGPTISDEDSSEE